MVERGVQPKALDNKPKVPQHLNYYVRAFWTLSSRRQIGMALSPISLSDIVSYLTIYPWYDIDKFIDYTVKMDSIFLEHHNNDRQEIDVTGSN